jgi:competence protein ComEA
MKLSQFTSEQRRGISVLAMTALALALFFFYSARGEAVPEVTSVQSTPAQGVASPALVIYVDVTGKVRSPGVYQLPEGARVIDAVEVAGGLKRGFNASHINMARRLVDGEQVAIRSEKFEAITPPSGRKGVFTGKVSINTGSKAHFDSLTGIGPVLAQRIVDYRSKNGPFVKIEDIQNVSGIGASIFAQISDRLTL